ncbi:DUF4432 family protein [Paenibacillus abyssi]|uniref:DUF4432 domain-containing protein n=1 Tax=Paenibacillus abyssi TaxID=1340531 RepID=A0A917D2H2_9BACL|nr:DUF4432 family protein [Paenibacillus abyssi]GGG08628.1 hypothetical protein GCM10010916_26860 [Paenibacillus abyssi]
METTVKLRLNELPEQKTIDLPGGGYIEKRLFTDKYNKELTILTIYNGRMAFTVLPERGLEIGDIVVDGETMSWERSGHYLLHPDHADLQARNGIGWLDGFYSAVAVIGPELFGTPGEGLTLHGTGSYSPAVAESVHISCTGEDIVVEGKAVVRGCSGSSVFEKEIKMVTKKDASLILREETTWNCSDAEQTLDDGYHIQLSGRYMHDGGRYVLPAPSRTLLLRDSAPPEADPLRIYPISQGKRPIRCYQYVPQPVIGMDQLGELAPFVQQLRQRHGVTAEMMVNDRKDAAGFVIRALDDFSKSLIAKEIDESFMFSFEPCRTRPNRMSQKHIDGEAFVLQPGHSAVTQCIIGVTRDAAMIGALAQAITLAARK